MIQKTLILLLILGFSANTIAQNILSEQNYGGANSDRLTATVQTPDGGLLFGGNSNSNGSGDVSSSNGGFDWWVARTDIAGNILWERSYGGSANEFLNYIVKTSDGGFLLAGYTASADGDVSNNYGNNDAWVVKIAANGNIQWEKNYGGTNADIFTTILPTADGGYLFSGNSSSTTGDVSGNNGSDDAWIVKTDATGNVQWTQNYGGSNVDSFSETVQTADGGYLLGGTTYSSDGDVSSLHGFADYWVVKTDATGNLQWEQNYGGSLADNLRAIVALSNGTFLIGGDAESSDSDVTDNHGSSDYWIANIDATGNILWAKSYGANQYDVLYDIVIAPDGGFLLGGQVSPASGGDISSNYGSSDAWVVKIDATGNIIWEQSYGGSDQDQTRILVPALGGGYILGNSSQSTNNDVTSGNNGGRDYWLVKIDDATAPTLCTAKTQVTAETGDAYIDDSCYGVILTSPNGSCFRVRVQDDGTLKSEAIVCPQ